MPARYSGDGGSTTSDVPTRIGQVETASVGTLPTSMSLALAQSGMDDARMARAATMLAHYFDLPPAWFLKPYNAPGRPNVKGLQSVDQFTDPLNGGPISLATARRFMRPHEPEVIGQMLQQITDSGYTTAGQIAKPAVMVFVKGNHPRVSAAADKAVALLNSAIGATVIHLVPPGTPGAVSISIDERDFKYADAEFSDTHGNPEKGPKDIVGNRAGLVDYITLAHEMGHALGMSHPAPGTTANNYIGINFNANPKSWPSRVAPVGLMGNEMNPNDPNYRGNGLSAGEVEWLRAKYGYTPAESTLELTKTRGGGTRPVPGTGPVNAGRIAAAVKALAPLAGERLPFTAALAFAMQLASSKTNLDLFTSNLVMTARLRGLSPVMAAEIARRAAAAAVTFRSTGDVASFVAPGAAGAIAAGEHPAAAEAAASEASAMEPGNISLEATGVTAKIAFGQQIVAGLTMSGDFFKSLQNSETDYNKQAAEIAKAVKIPFTDSVVGHAIGAGLRALWSPFGEIVNTIGYVGEQAFPGLFNQGVGPFVQTKDPTLDAWWQDTRDIFFHRRTELDTLAEFGIPPWFTLGFELFAASTLDPVQIGLNALKEARAARTVFGLAEAGKPEEWAARVEDFLSKPLGRIGKFRDVTIGEYLRGEILRADGAERFYARAVRNFRAYFVTEGIHPIVAERAWTLTRSLEKLGMSEVAQLEGINSVLKGGLGITPDIGSFAADISTHVEALNVKTAQQLPLLLADGTAYTAPTIRLTNDAAAAEAILTDVLGDVGRPWMQEIPHLGGPVTRAEIALATSPLADTGIGKVMRATFQMLPKSGVGQFEVSIEEGTGAVRDFERGLRGYETLSVDELAQARLQFSSALSSTNPLREIELSKINEAWQRTALERINLRYGISQEMSTAIVDEIMTPRKTLGQRYAAVFGVSEATLDQRKAFAAFQEGSSQSVERFPILSRTQQANYLTMIDPYVYRQGIAETIGTLRKWRAAVYQAFGHEIGFSNEAMIHVRRAFDNSVDLIVRDLMLSWFKPLVVLRPAYILRVVGMEELGRFLGTLGFTRRVEAGKLLSGERVYEALIGAPTESRVMGAAQKVAGMLPEDVRLAAAERIRLAGSTTFDVPELQGLVEGPATITFTKPAFLADDPIFNTAMSRYSAASPSGMSNIVQDALSPGKWGVVDRTDPQFMDSWYRALVLQYGLDPLGRRYLTDVARGVDQEVSVRSAMSWLTSPGDGLAEARALMGGPYTREALEVQVRKGVRYAQDLTSGHPDLAAAARDQTLTPQMLNAVPEDARPLVVHGPLAYDGVMSKANPVKRFVAAWGKMILEEPTNRFTRQPYGKVWYDRVYSSLIETAQANGTTITPELLEGFASVSRKFAAEQNARIMFDFSRSGRLDSITRNVFMFMQPLLEFPVSWSRVIRQNPAMLWQVVRGGRAALESGFIQTDPSTGEQVIPLSWWAGAAPLLAAAGMIPGFVPLGRMDSGTGGGWSLSAPLTSFNLFAQSTFPLAGPWGGHLLGTDIPMIVPSLNPEALWAVQQLVNNIDMNPSIKARISSWVFAYGNLDPGRPISLLPAYLRHGLEAAFPEWLSNETNMQTTHFLQLQQAMGLTPDPAAAATQSREFSLMRAFFALVFPAAPRIEFPTKPLEDQFHALVDSAGSFAEGRTAFLQAHPGLDLITLARTMWAQDNSSPISITPSQLVNQLLNGKGAKQFATDHPMWVWAIIPQELRDGTMDAGAYFSQIASGQREVLTPTQFLTKGDVQKGWDAYFALREGHLAWQEAHPLLGIGDPSYEQESLSYTAAVDRMKQTNPSWAHEFDTFELSGVDPKVMAESRRLAADPMFAETDAGKGLVEYFALRDPIESELAKLEVHSILTTAAETAGLTARYNEGLAKIEAAHPDFATAYRLFFSGDLQHVLTNAEKMVNKIPQDVFDQQITPWWEHFETLRSAPNMAQDEASRSQAYTDLRIFTNRAYADFSAKDNPMILRWKLSDPNYRADYLVSLVSRPYVYLTLFDKTFLIGDTSSKSTEKLWTMYANTRSDISEREATDPNFSSSAAYKILDAWVAANAKVNKTFGAQVAAASTWGYTFSKVIDQPTLQQSMFGTTLGTESKSYWGAFLDAVGQIQHVVDQAKVGGSYDPRAKVAYNVLRGKLVEYVNILRDSSPEFKAQWDYLENASGPDPAISYFMPVFGDYFGPLTGYAGG